MIFKQSREIKAEKKRKREKEEKREKRRKKREKRRKGRKKKRRKGGKFLWNCTSPSTSRHAERVAPKAPRGAKILCRFGLEVQHSTSMITIRPTVRKL